MQVEPMDAAEFRDIRDVLNLTQGELAAILGIGRQAVYRKEHGDRAISPTTALAMRGLLLELVTQLAGHQSCTVRRRSV